MQKKRLKRKEKEKIDQVNAARKELQQIAALEVRGKFVFTIKTLSMNPGAVRQRRKTKNMSEEDKRKWALCTYGTEKAKICSMTPQEKSDHYKKKSRDEKERNQDKINGISIVNLKN